MAMTTCPECKKPVSDTALSCPHCGYQLRPPSVPARKKQETNWVVIGIVSVAVVFVGIAFIGLLAAIAIPSFVNARNRSMQAACANNMTILAAAKEQAVAKYQHKPGDEIPDAEMDEFLGGGGVTLSCPAKGEYSVNAAGEEPSCSKHGSLSDAQSGRRTRTANAPAGTGH